MGVEFFLRNMIETALDNGYHFKTISEWGDCPKTIGLNHIN